MSATASTPPSRFLYVAAFALALALLLGAALAPPAQAADPPPLVWQTGENGSGAGQTTIPRGIVTSPTDGHVFVADQGNNRIQEFTAWGGFVRAFGWDVAPEGAPGDTSTDQLETCTVTCQEGSVGAGPGQIPVVQGLALDSNGDLYLTEATCCGGNYRVQKLDLSGPEPAFEWMIGTGVNQGPNNPGNLCTAADVAGGDTCGAGSDGSGPGQFDWPDAGVGSFIAIDGAGTPTTTDDTLYVGDQSRIQLFDADGHYLEDLPDPDAVLDAKRVQSLAVGSTPATTSLYVGFGEFQDNVTKLDLSGQRLCTMEVKRPTAIAADAAGSVWVVSAALESTPWIDMRIVQFDSASCDEVGGFNANEVGFDKSTGLATGSACLFSGSSLYAANSILNNSFIRSYGPFPENAALCPPPKAAPEIDAQYALAVDTDGATVRAQINPQFWPDTTYYVEYGTEACLEAGWQASCVRQQPAPPGVELKSGVINRDTTTAGVFLPDLSAEAAYRYRFVAQSSGGGPVRGLNGSEATDGADASFTTPALPPPPREDCPNQAFRLGASAFLPDCRAFEMVSPVDKNGAGIEPFISGASGSANNPAAVDQSASSGEAITYSTKQAFGDAIGSPYSSQYVSSRDPATGWSTHSLNAPHEGFPGGVENVSLDLEFKAFSEDLTQAWIVHEANPPLAPCAPLDSSVLYRRDNATDTYEALHCEPNVPLANGGSSIELVGISADGCRAVFRSRGQLTADAEEGGALNSDFQLYESSCEGPVSPQGPLRLVSVLPGGGNCKGESSAGSLLSDSNDGHSKPVWHAFSTDAHRLYWSCGDTLYLRTDPDLAIEGDEETTQVAAPFCPPGGGACRPPRFQSASPDGSRMLFTIGNAAGFGLELYDAQTEGTTQIATGLEAGLRTDLMGASEDLSRAYLVSGDILTAAPNSEGDKAVVGRPNLFLYQEGSEFQFIGTLSANDLHSDQETPSPIHPQRFRRISRVSPDGLHAAFASAAPLTHFDNTDVNSGEADAEVFVYDASANGGAGKTLCVSCNPTGVRPTGTDIVEKREYWSAATIPGWQTALYQGRPLSEDGRRLFFDSFEALLTRDTNKRRDVYEWQQASSKAECEEKGAELFNPAAGGCISLISSGQDPADSEFIDASRDGSDVFIRTSESLLPQDPGLKDVYDARIGGGFPQPTTPAACEGEACQSPPAPPDDPTPASSAFQGAGNVVEPATKPTKCRKGKVRRHGKCVPKHRRAKHKRHHRAANHNRGGAK